MKRFHRLALTTPDGLLATCGGVGLSPIAPGTAGSVVALIPAWFMLGLPLELQLLAVLAGFLLGVAACSRFEARLETHDHGAIVWDELVGVLLTVLGAAQTPATLLLGLFWFRLFDILKPWPVSWLDRKVSGGLGVMVDDIAAAVLAWVALLLSLRWLPLPG